MVRSIGIAGLTVLRVDCSRLSDLVFVAITNRKQHLLCKVQVATLFTVIFVDVGFND
jgi:hypothetical protein